MIARLLGSLKSDGSSTSADCVPPPAQLHGSLDNVKDGVCYGWAACRGREGAVEVEILLDGQVVARGMADGFREDLRAAGVGTGHHAFTIPLSDACLDGNYHRVAASAFGQTVGQPMEIQLVGRLTPERFDREAPWIDQSHAQFEAELERRVREGEVSDRTAQDLRFFRENGYVVLEQAIPHDLIDRALADVESSWNVLPQHLQVVNSAFPAPVPINEVTQLPGFRESSFRYLDFHNWSEAAAEIMMNPSVLGFLQAYLGPRIVAMQSLLFENGTEQRAHQDFAFVHSLNPALLAGAWVALEDVQPDAGPLFYYPRSHHRVRKHVFENGSVLAEGDGPHVRAFEDYLQKECEELQLQRITFTPKKGDVLIWHSALVHGGSPRANRGRTRKSIVSHYSTAEAYPFDRRHPTSEPVAIVRNGQTYYGLQKDRHEENIFKLA